MKRAIRDLFGGFGSLLTGMKITLQQFFKPQVTLHYPHQSLKMAKRFRGHIVLVRDPVTGQSLCVACKSCEKACPSDCIVVDGLKKEGEKKKSVTDFKLNFSTCSLCGSCVEVCPTDALAFSKDYNRASTDKQSFYQIDLVKRLESEGPAPVAAPAPLPTPALNQAPAPVQASAPTPAKPSGEAPK